MTAPKKPAPKRRALTVNVMLDGQWYGPGYGNAEDYPDDVELGEHLFDPPEG